MAQPKVQIKKETLDHVLNGLGILGLVIMLLLTTTYYPTLPDRIPVHFNALGEPDGYGGKVTLWVIFGLSAALYIFLNGITNSPHIGNYSVPITTENAPRQYQNMQRMSRALNATLCICFAYIHYSIIQTALGNTNGLGLWFLLSFVLAIFGIISYFLYQAKVLR